jgi:hypothetical protein
MAKSPPVKTKKTRQPKLPRYLDWLSNKLELKFRSDLDLPRGVNEVAVGVGNRTEQWIERFINVEVQARSRCAAHNVSTGSGHSTGGDGICCRIHAGHILLISDIEEIAKQLHAVLFGYLKALGKPYVANPVHRLVERVASDIDSIRSSRSIDTADS